MKKQLAAVILVTGLVTSLTVQATELAGVTMPDTMTNDGIKLELNGLGHRKKFIFSVYIGALYLVARSKDAAAILNTDMAKAVSMHFMRSVSKSQLVESFSDGFANNAKDKVVSQKSNTDKLFELLSDVKEGDILTFFYAPGKGTTFSKSGKALGTFEGKEFAQLIFSLWMGPNPPSADLKKGMLGA